MARAPDNATYISDEQIAMYVSKEQAAKYNANPVPYSGKQVINIYNTPSGITNSVQFLKNATEFGGDTGFTYNTTTNSVNIQGNLNIGGLINGKFYTNTANFRITGGNTGQILTTTGNGNLSWTTLPDIVSSDWNATSGINQILNKPNLSIYVTTANLNSTLNSYVTTTNFNSTISSLATVATSGSYNDLLNKPNLANVATSGSYTDLSNKPILSTIATTGSYNDLFNAPNFATVAITGSYNSLLNRPTDLSNFTNDLDFISRTEIESYVSNEISSQINALKSNVDIEYDTLKELADSLKFLLSINIDGGDASGGTPIDGSFADSTFTNTLDGGSAYGNTN